jgi:mevalonate kinase
MLLWKCSSINYAIRMQKTSNDPASWYAHGKLLISGEYLVLRGARALSVPLKYGQSLQVEQSPGIPLLRWEAVLPGKKWFAAQFDPSTFEIRESDYPELAKRLQHTLQEARNLNPSFLVNSGSTSVTSTLNFPPEWGIGSSSSLLANIGRWAGVNPYELNRRIFGGSGYDIAAALSDTPIIYHLDNGQPRQEATDFNPPFAGKLWLIYQNIKQSSKTAVQKFSEIVVPATSIDAISEITLQMSVAKDFHDFTLLMQKHEQITGKVLQQEPVKPSLFPDFEGSIKSLGAWGGDFLLAASTKGEEYIRRYFAEKKLNTIFRLEEMRL